MERLGLGRHGLLAIGPAEVEREIVIDFVTSLHQPTEEKIVSDRELKKMTAILSPVLVCYIKCLFVHAAIMNIKYMNYISYSI